MTNTCNYNQWHELSSFYCGFLIFKNRESHQISVTLCCQNIKRQLRHVRFSVDTSLDSFHLDRQLHHLAEQVYKAKREGQSLSKTH